MNHSSVLVPLVTVGTAVYSAGVLVTITSTGTVFHRSSYCHQVKKVSEAKEIDLDEVGSRTPCRTCFRDSPRFGSLHQYCATCSSFRPCEHNGGIYVPLVRTRRSRSPYMDQGETYVRWDYVWPENLTAHVM